MTNNGNEVWLGLDVSTNCIGVCLFENDSTPDGKILALTYVEPKIDKRVKGIEALFLKSKVFERFIQEKIDGITIDKVVIEEPLLTSNNAFTVETLIRFNTLIANSIYTMFGIIPIFISSYNARMFSFPELISIRKINKKDKLYTDKELISAAKHSKICLFGDYKFDIDKKEVMMEHVNETYKHITWELDKKGELKKTNYDSCDALICLLGYRRLRNHPDAVGKIVNYKVNPDSIDYTVDFAGETFEHTIFLSGK
jgi:hypothetical protein